MDHKFPVRVVDDSGADVAGARVCLVARAALGAESHPYPSLADTHSDGGGGKYDEKVTITPTEGDWILVVSIKGKSPAIQPFKFKKDKSGEFTAVPTGFHKVKLGKFSLVPSNPVATVTITGALRKVGPTSVKELAFHATLFPASEIVFIAGVDYDRADISGGWLFHEYGFNRAEVLRREKKIHAGTIVTVFSTAEIWRTTRVFGVKQWVDIDVAQLGDPSTRATEASRYVPTPGLDIHITDFYKYLATVGNREPKSVKEIGIFSHSFPGGPILYNTGQRASYKDIPDRDPKDFDARGKDFNSTNFPAYAKMADAPASNCRFTIWGCSFTVHFKFTSRRALKAINDRLGEDDFFLVRSEVEDPHHPEIGVYIIEEENTSELRHRRAMDWRFRNSTYASQAAAKLNIEVRAGCPGTGSDPKNVDGIEMLMVDLVVYADVFDYFHKKFAPEFAETNGKWDKGYIDYHSIQSRTPVATPPFSTQYYYITINTQPYHGRTVGAQIQFGNDKKVNHPTANVQVVMKSVADLVTPGKKGTLFILKDADKTKSQGVFVQEDEKTFMITLDAKGDWTVKGAEVI
jgi:hypothetical protein